jgi:thioredoxin-related protein
MNLDCITRVICLAALAVAFSGAAAQADGDLWTVSFDDAKKAAEKDGKDIMMEFTGSDWCPPCMALAKEVLSKEEFQSEAPKHFVLLKLDNPQDKSKQSKEEQEQYEKLSGEFQIEGVPTIILADAKGRPYAKLVGYGGDTAEAYTKNLVEKTKLRKERDENFAKAETAEGGDKAKLLAQAIAGIDSELAISTYRDTVEEIIKLDGDNAQGLKSKYENLLKLSDVKKQLQEIQLGAREDADGALKKLDALITDSKLEGELLQTALFTKAQLVYATDKPAAKKALEEAVAAAPDTDMAAQIKGIIERVFAEEPKEEESKEEPKDE